MRKEVKLEEGGAGEDGGEHQAVQYHSADTLALWGWGELFYLTKSMMKLSPGLELRATISKRRPPVFVCIHVCAAC